MADLDGVDIKKGKIGANTIATGDAISGLVIASPAPAGLAHGKATKLYNMVDVKNLGISLEFDTANGVNLYRHIKEFYRMAGEGKELHLMLVPQATTMVAMCEDTQEELGKKLLIEAMGNIRQIAIAVNPTEATTHLNGLPDDVYNSIAMAQGLAKWAFERHMPCQILLEGYDYASPAASVIDLRKLPNLKAPKVSLVIGQDWTYAEGLTGNAQKMADVGTALGTLSKARINQNIGENESFDLPMQPVKLGWFPGFLLTRKM
ncbi:DUF2586 family protein [Aquimarina algiphila]|uniref:Uncharacterized protein n=1 Tax=Aquimarina algiphila TaxID=2047982 RepID=A0A554VEX4_9FLAO|nr:DUF2586 family protein [Aquimarina algiphila]TSE05667.1 hypothetical protein FOF46_21810 [Aquimarina algiphila]